MPCAFNLCELWNGILLGGLSSALAAGATALILNQRQRKRFGKAAAKGYKGYEWDENTRTLGDVVLSTADIVYKGGNMLHITLTHDKLTWEGDILMELETFGSIVWRYKNIPPVNGRESHWFGFKKVIVRDEPGRTYVYLIGEKEKGYGIEVLVRDK